MQVHAHQGRMHLGGRRQAQRLAGQHRGREVAHRGLGQLGVVLEARRTVAVRFGQRNPQLGGVDVRGRLAFLGMGDAVAGRHQVDLAGADDLGVAQAIAVQHFAADHPGEGLQADVRMRADLHARRRGVGRTGVVEKAPGADLAQGALGNGALDGNAAHIGGAGGQVLGLGVELGLGRGRVGHGRIGLFRGGSHQCRAARRSRQTRLASIGPVR